jgi:hypothetical protein
MKEKSRTWNKEIREIEENGNGQKKMKWKKRRKNLK